MRRAMELAGNGLGNVSPNPMVGAVVVYNGKIIGEGWHRQFGGPHAEVEAINSIKDHQVLPESTLFVNLEPCAHYGKTPPCTDLIMKSGLRRVVLANTDPNPMVGGKGIRQLQDGGVEVVTGVMRQQGTFLNRRFFRFHQNKRPYIILKWAQTSDGFIARENFDSKWISNEYSRKLVHRYRAEEDAILVGRATAQYDNPQLTTRDWHGKDPLRLVIDPELKLDGGLKLFDGRTPTICYNFHKDETDGNISWVKLPREGFLPALWQDLYQKEVQSILVEGGGTLINSLVQANFWDEARMFVAPLEFEKGIRAPELQGSPDEEQLIVGDRLKVYYNKNHG